MAKLALPGRAQPIPTAAVHFVNGGALKPPFSAGLEEAVCGLGCFWGAKRKFWQTERRAQAFAAEAALAWPPPLAP